MLTVRVWSIGEMFIAILLVDLLMFMSVFTLMFPSVRTLVGRGGLGPPLTYASVSTVVFTGLSLFSMIIRSVYPPFYVMVWSITTISSGWAAFAVFKLFIFFTVDVLLSGCLWSYAGSVVSFG